MPMIGGPNQPRGGLVFQARVRILFQFRADGERQPILDDGDFILNELSDVVRRLVWETGTNCPIDLRRGDSSPRGEIRRRR